MAGIWIPCNTSANKLKYGGKGFSRRIFLPGRGQSIKIKKILFAWLSCICPACLDKHCGFKDPPEMPHGHFINLLWQSIKNNRKRRNFVEIFRKGCYNTSCHRAVRRNCRPFWKGHYGARGKKMVLPVEPNYIVKNVWLTLFFYIILDGLAKRCHRAEIIMKQKAQIGGKFPEGFYFACRGDIITTERVCFLRRPSEIQIRFFCFFMFLFGACCRL